MNNASNSFAISCIIVQTRLLFLVYFYSSAILNANYVILVLACCYQKVMIIDESNGYDKINMVYIYKFQSMIVISMVSIYMTSSHECLKSL